MFIGIRFMKWQRAFPTKSKPDFAPFAVLQTKEPRSVNKTRFPFVIRNGGRTMVNRKKFEDYLNNSTSI